MKKVARNVLMVIGVMALLVLTQIVPVDERDYQSTEFYKRTLLRQDSIKSVLEKQTDTTNLQIGWGIANITPSPPVRLTGKNWTPFEHIFDSVYVRAMVFTDNNQKIAFLSYDLWIIHPHLAEAIRNRIMAADLGVTGIYFTANHSHTSIGGWADGLLGSLIIGGNDPGTLGFITEQTLVALKEANTKTQQAALGYQEVATSGMTENRLDTLGKLDQQLRVLKISQLDGSQAVLTTFAAHSVYMNKDINTLSADYSGGFLQNVVSRDRVDFACFAPGATGSHTPVGRKPFTRQKMAKYAQQLDDYLGSIYESIALDTTTVLKFAEWPVEMRSPHFRIANHWRLRPWLFHWIMGKEEASITALRMGNIVLMGLPVELSGEYYEEFNALCKSRGLHLMITTFNGNYLGYVNPERYYFSLNRAETREMNWYGPQAGEYYVSIMKEMLKIL